MPFDHLGQGQPYEFRRVDGPDPGAWTTRRSWPLSKSGQLSLSLAEMRAIQAPLRRRSAATRPTASSRRSPRPGASTARTRRSRAGSSSKAGRSTTCSSRRSSRRPSDLDLDWLVSVFADNAGVVRFDDEYDVCFKVETHNHPSAIDPYGGVEHGPRRRDPRRPRHGPGAKPICNTDVFCVAPPDLAPDRLPAGRPASQARAQGGRRGRPRLRQPDGHPDGQRGARRRPRLPGQSAGLLRDGRRHPARDGRQARRAGRPDRRHRRPDRPRRHPRRDVQLGRADRRERDRSPAARCRSATRSPRRWCST